MGRPSLLLPKYLVPVRPRGQVLESHGVLIRDDRIEAILPREAAMAAHSGCEVIELSDHALLPGLINMHTHSPMTLLRGIADDLDLHEWLNSHIWPAESRHVNAQFVADGTRLAMAEMIRCGTTCFNDNYFYPDAMAEAALDAGMRAFIGLPLLDQPTCWAENFAGYMEKGLSVAARFKGEPMLRFTLAPHAPYSVSDTGLEEVARVSREFGLKVHLHCLETSYDIDHSNRTYGLHPLDRLAQFGLVNDSLLAVHMTQLDEGNIKMLAQQGVNVVHCPQSNMKLASGICPVRDLLNAGVNVCIGTDGAASNNNLDLLEEVRSAALLAKVATADATALNAITAVEMMTINGATALGFESEIGSIEVGKKADLCAIDLECAATQPLHNLFSQITYAASSSQFSDVWIEGRRVMAESRLNTLDEPEILATAKAWRTRLEAPSQSEGVAV